MHTLSSKFNYGFEIEGVFSRNLWDTLCNLVRKERRLRQTKALLTRITLPINVDLGSDGSIRIDRTAITHIRKSPDDPADWIFSPGGNGQEKEMRLGIFKSYKQTMNYLSLFKNKKNYLENKSCGLHLHIRPTEKDWFFKQKIWDYDFIKKLEGWAVRNLCEKVKTRIKSNKYCSKYKGLNSTFRDYIRGEKWKFMRNHPKKTIEFRFFSTCEHKEKNISKFLDYFFTTLSRIRPLAKTHFILPSLLYPKAKVFTKKFIIRSPKERVVRINLDRVRKKRKKKELTLIWYDPLLQKTVLLTKTQIILRKKEIKRKIERERTDLERMRGVIYRASSSTPF